MGRSEGAEPVEVVDRLLWRDAQQMLHRHAAPDEEERCQWCGWEWPCPARRLAERAEEVSRRPTPETMGADGGAGEVAPGEPVRVEPACDPVAREGAEPRLAVRPELLGNAPDWPLEQPPTGSRPAGEPRQAAGPRQRPGPRQGAGTRAPARRPGDPGRPRNSGLFD